jgi:hypothetical protein
LRIDEVLKQTVIASVAIDDAHLGTPIASHLRHRFLKQFHLQFGAVGDGARLVLRLKDLTEIV